jgi:iron complex transport system substrate-binding protein
MMKKWSLLLIGLTLLVFVSACSNASSNAEEDDKANASGETLTIEHELGTTEVTKNPETVVVFDFGALETLDKLGVKVAGVAQDNLPSYLSKYESDEYVNIGSLKEPDFETIYGMDPDVILISGRQSAVYEDLKEIAPTIYVGLDTTNYMESFKKNVNTLAKIFSKESEAEQELVAINESIDALHEKASESDGKGLILLTNGGKISAYGAGSRFGILHDVFGVKTADENIEASTHGMKVTFEYVVEKNPDYLFVIDRDSAIGNGEAAKKVIENALVEKTNAYKNDQIVYLDPEVWYLSGGGLMSVPKMVDEISSAIK